MSRLCQHEYDIQGMSIAQLHRIIQREFRFHPIALRSKFRLLSDYVDWLKNGTKCTTIRYRPNAIDVPESDVVPLVETNGSQNNDFPIGDVRILKMAVKKFSELSEADAHRDGFHNCSELKSALQALYSPIYGHIEEDQYVSIYTIQHLD